MISVRTGSRLHFGLINPGKIDHVPQFGGAGLMIDAPGLELRARPAAEFAVVAPEASNLALRVREFYDLAMHGPDDSSDRDDALSFEIVSSPPDHVGLGTGTQLGMAVAATVARHRGASMTAIELARSIGRGDRSSVGIHGFEGGGFVVDGGKTSRRVIAPLVERIEFPAEWRILLVLPRNRRGLFGSAEVAAFEKISDLTELPARLEDILNKNLVPALQAKHLDVFGEALHDYGRLAGEFFRETQGGPFANRFVEELVEFCRSAGIRGTGQSSWGPAVYGISADEDLLHSMVASIQSAFELDSDEIMVTGARNRNAEILD